MKPEKNYNVFEVEGTIFLENHKEGSYHIGEVDCVDVVCLNDIADELNELYRENQAIQEKVFKLMDWLEKEKGVNREEIKEWWNA